MVAHDNCSDNIGIVKEPDENNYKPSSLTENFIYFIKILIHLGVKLERDQISEWYNR